jgi:hypothetical protein
MGEMLPKIRTSQHGSDPLWKSEKRRRRSKTGDAVGRARWRSLFLGALGVEFFAERGRSLDRRMGSTSGAPKIPCFPRRQEGNASYRSVPTEFVSLKGCTPISCTYFVPFCAHAKMEHPR